MSMIKKVTATISKDNKKVKLSSPLYFYKYDSLTIEFEIEKYNFELKSYQRINLLKAVGFVETANGKDSVETTILQGQTIMIKLLPEHTSVVGESKIQFVIVDGDGCQSATPPIPYVVEELINDVIIKVDDEGNIVIEENNDTSTYIRECEATDGEMGECLFTSTEEETAEVGNYITELEIEFENGTRLSVDNPITLSITQENICQHRQFGRTVRMF